MNQELTNIIKERLDRLPIEVVTAIKSVPWIEKMHNIAQMNKLTAEKEGLFVTETINIVLGMESPKTYPTNLATNAGLNDDTVIKIAKEVDEQIITPIMKMVEEKKQKQPATEEPEEPIVITAETREEALKELSRRSMKNQNPPVLVPELVPSNLPMVEKGEMVHDVPHIETKSSSNEVSLPDYRYDGKDPYREPLK